MSPEDLNRCARQTQPGKSCEQPSTACSLGGFSNQGPQKIRQLQTSCLRTKYLPRNYSTPFSTFGLRGGRSFFASALSGVASLVFSVAATLPRADVSLALVSGPRVSAGLGSGVALSMWTFNEVVTSGFNRNSTSCSPMARRIGG